MENYQPNLWKQISNKWLGINLFDNSKKKTISDLPKGAKECRCKGLDVNCIDCDGKGYYF